MYGNNLLILAEECPLQIMHIGEKALGVSRDKYSAFWEIAYVKHFDGERLLVPAVNSTTDLTILPLLGAILCHGYMVCGYLPIRIAFPVIAAVLCGPNVEITDDITWIL